MNINKIKTKLKNNSKAQSSWIEKAKYRKENEAWLDISFAIAVKVMSVLKFNKQTGISPKSQKELANIMNCTPQYINKVLKGKENLTLESINRIEKAIGAVLITAVEYPAINHYSTIVSEIEVPRQTIQSFSQFFNKEVKKGNYLKRKEVVSNVEYSTTKYIQSSSCYPTLELAA